MSEVNANITVSPIELTVTPTDNQITITPSDITLSVYTAGQGTPGAAGIQGQLQFNNLGVLAGAANTQVTANGNVRFQNIGNLKINGGANAYFLQTDGTGNLTWAQGTANVSGNGTAAGANTQIQITDGTGNFVSGPGFTFDIASNIFTVPGNAFASNFIGTLANGNSNITMATANGNIEFYVNGNTSTKIIDNQLVTSNLKLTSNNITLGANAGGISQGPFGIAIGAEAGANLQAFTAIALGVGAGGYNQGESAIAIGQDAGYTDQGIKSVAIGYGAGLNSIGDYTIAIGHRAGSNTTSNNSIILNAANADFQGPLSNAFYVNPVRNANTPNALYYNAATGEITFDLVNNGNTANFAAYAGNVTLASQPNITSLGTLSNLFVSGNSNVSDLNVSGTTSIQQAKEKVTSNSSPATGTINYDLLTQAIILKTANASGNFTLNFRGNSSTTLDSVMSSNQSITCSFINKNGATAYLNTSNIQIDGTTITPLWVSPGYIGNGTPNGQDFYTFNIIKTAANTYNVLASRTGFV